MAADCIQNLTKILNSTHVDETKLGKLIEENPTCVQNEICANPTGIVSLNAATISRVAKNKGVNITGADQSVCVNPSSNQQPFSGVGVGNNPASPVSVPDHKNNTNEYSSIIEQSEDIQTTNSEKPLQPSSTTNNSTVVKPNPSPSDNPSQIMDNKQIAKDIMRVLKSDTDDNKEYIVAELLNGITDEKNRADIAKRVILLLLDEYAKAESDAEKAHNKGATNYNNAIYKAYEALTKSVSIVLKTTSDDNNSDKHKRTVAEGMHYSIVTGLNSNHEHNNNKTRLSHIGLIQYIFNSSNFKKLNELRDKYNIANKPVIKKGGRHTKKRTKKTRRTRRPKIYRK